MLIFGGMILATLVCVVTAGLLVLEYSPERFHEPYRSRLYWRAACAVVAAGFAALCMSGLKALVR
jgi:uncharacterized membrane protein